MRLIRSLPSAALFPVFFLLYGSLTGCADELAKAVSDVVSSMGDAVSTQPAQADAVGWQQSDGSIPTEPGANAECYGIQEGISAQQLLTLANLKYPQSGKAIRSVLGSPDCVSGQIDFYKIQSSRWLAIPYSPNGHATGYKYGET